MTAEDKLKEAFIAGGREAIDADPELRALLAASPEFQRTLAALEDVDAALPDLAPIRMPAPLLDRVLALSEPKPSVWAWLHARDYALGALAFALILLPWTALFLLQQNRHEEFQVLEMHDSIVTLDMAAIEERALPKAAGASEVQVVSVEPQVSISLERTLPKYKQTLASAFAKKEWPNVNPSALVNAFAYTRAKEDVELQVEIGPSPWSSDTRLVRVYVSAAIEAREAALTVSFNEERVMSYRRIAEPGTPGQGSDTLAAGGQFTALFEIVPLQRICAVLREDSVYANLRYVDGIGERRTLQKEGLDKTRAFDAMSNDYRFAAAAAWFALEAKGGVKSDGLVTRLQRVMATASRALGTEAREERVAFVSLVRAASDQAQKVIRNDHQ
jgi:hypothetical protein